MATLSKANYNWSIWWWLNTDQTKMTHNNQNDQQRRFRPFLQKFCSIFVNIWMLLECQLSNIQSDCYGPLMSNVNSIMSMWTQLCLIVHFVFINFVENCQFLLFYLFMSLYQNKNCIVRTVWTELISKKIVIWGIIVVKSQCHLLCHC
jgi:hypothetical protein